MDEAAVVTVAFGPEARHCAALSIESLRRVGCTLPAYIVGDAPVDGVDAQHIQWMGKWPFVKVARERYSFRAGLIKPRLQEMIPAQRTLYVDADTTFVSDPTAGLGEFLRDANFAIALHQSGCTVKRVRKWYGYRETAGTLRIAGDVKVPNAGVMMWDRSRAAELLFSTWTKEWLRYRNWDDQFPLVRALAIMKKRGLRVARLPFGWNSKTLEAATHIHHYFGTGAAAPGGKKALWAGRKPV